MISGLLCWREARAAASLAGLFQGWLLLAPSSVTKVSADKSDHGLPLGAAPPIESEPPEAYLLRKHRDDHPRQGEQTAGQDEDAKHEIMIGN
jgi:hypothetical protein